LGICTNFLNSSNQQWPYFPNCRRRHGRYEFALFPNGIYDGLRDFIQFTQANKPNEYWPRICADSREEWLSGRTILGEAGISESSLLEKLETTQKDYFMARQDNANKDIISQRYELGMNEG